MEDALAALEGFGYGFPIPQVSEGLLNAQIFQCKGVAVPTHQRPYVVAPIDKGPDQVAAYKARRARY